MKTKSILVSTVVALFISFYLSGFVNAAPFLSPQTVISRNVPAYTNNDYNGAFPPGLANDNNYGNFWISNNVPAYMAYDLSGVPVNQRGQVILAWYNEPATKPYNPTLIGDVYYRAPANYTIEANAAAGGSYPASGWVTLATVTSNPYTSRQHQIDLTGYNWVRMNMTSCPGVFSIECGINMDIHNAANGVSDDWMFFGDSITSLAMDHDPYTSDGGTGTFSQLVNAQNSSYFPVQQNGGIGGWATADPLAGSPSYFTTWLSLFPGNFVVLNYGTNDANNNATTGGNPDPAAVAAFYNNMTTMVQQVITAGKIPVIPKIPWGNTANIQANGPAMNAKIDQLYIDFPQIVPGPDLWTYFFTHQNLISGDNVHPNNAGFVGMRQQWVDKMVTDVYTVPTVAAAPTGGTFGTTQHVSMSGTSGATFYYTTDGSTPSTSSTVYSSSITIAATTTLKFIAVNKGLNKSAVQTEQYNIVIPTATPTPTSIPTATPTQAQSSGDSGNHNESKPAPTCDASVPGSAPHLYAASAHSATSIEVFFTDAGNPVDHYVLAYGTKSGEYQYGVNSFGEVGKGQQSYTINSLQPNTTYYFKVQAGNGCAPGAWSNEISTTTKGSFSTNQLDLTSSSVKEEKPSKNQDAETTPEVSPTPTAAKTYSININVKDTNNKPVEGAKVTMHSKVQTATTGKDGVAHFENIEEGAHKVLIAYQNYSGEQALNLSGDTQKIDLTIQVKPQNVLLAPQVIAGFSLFGLIIIILAVVLLKKSRK